MAVQRSVVETLLGGLVLVVAIGFGVHAYTRTDVGSVNGYELTAKFDRVDGISPGSDVRIGGIKVGTVVDEYLETETFLAVIKVSLDSQIRVPADSSAEVVSSGLLGDKYLSIVPGADVKVLGPGGEIRYTQSSISLESLIGRYLFSSQDSGGAAGGADGGQ